EREWLQACSQRIFCCASAQEWIEASTPTKSRLNPSRCALPDCSPRNIARPSPKVASSARPRSIWRLSPRSPGLAEAQRTRAWEPRVMVLVQEREWLQACSQRLCCCAAWEWILPGQWLKTL
ncbi:unnamed protein product, partial [Symbiodinium sp. KB8]